MSRENSEVMGPEGGAVGLTGYFSFMLIFLDMFLAIFYFCLHSSRYFVK